MKPGNSVEDKTLTIRKLQVSASCLDIPKLVLGIWEAVDERC
jgi:hypothetical protein